MTTCAVENRALDPPEGAVRYPAPVITAAAQRVQDSADMDMLGNLGGIDQLREAVEPDARWQLGAQLAQPGGLDLMVEIAHDLRSPLTSILFLSETLHNGLSGEVNELQRRQLALIYSAALGLSGLVSNSIELAAGGERLADCEPSSFSIVETLQALQSMVGPMAEEKELALQVRSEAFDHRLGHPVALSRVLLNLTCNALKFTEQGFVQITALAKHDNRVEFSVRDTGPGIDPQAIDRLYQPFHRSWPGAGFTFSGTGLGLAITRNLIAAMGSELQVETGSWGTRFHFEVELPLAPPSSAVSDLKPRAAGPKGGFEARTQLRPRSNIHPNKRGTRHRAHARAHH
jgi:signal transduction histidine kinase